MLKPKHGRISASAPSFHDGGDEQQCPQCFTSYSGDECPQCTPPGGHAGCSIPVATAVIIALAIAVAHFKGVDFRKFLNWGKAGNRPPASSQPVTVETPPLEQAPLGPPARGYDESVEAARQAFARAVETGALRDWGAAADAAREALGSGGPNRLEAQELLAKAKSGLKEAERRQHVSFLKLDRDTTDEMLAKAVKAHPNIINLQIDYCTSLTDLSPLSGLGKLEELNMMNCIGVRDYGFLKGITSLRSLRPHRATTEVQLLQIATCAPQIERLDLEWANIRDFSPLARLKNLRDFSMPPHATDAALAIVAAQHPDLEALGLRLAVSISDFSPIARLKRLKTLYPPARSQDELARIVALAPSVTDLVIVGTKGLTDLSFLSSLRNLNSLCISSCAGLATLKGLERQAGIRELRIVECDDLFDISAASRLPNLSTVNIQFCDGLSSILPFCDSANLRTVTIYGCPEISTAQLDSLRKKLPNCEVRKMGK